ncbi:hypothetical protein RhiirA5_413971 [Rhizophagus irregularis]|uniref:Uncharacterized protein n=1 Tax=Rhizophagus irregularis TaxID=588596 RepID=A0A2N0PVA0_9GLOM|nr:hypothetical protein RhiirA5_413971 [Rhizophagus irregularis]GBC34915.2 hypothetical protein GLOIN_2v1765309 [Rhizophagus irregularis DAOM 181602=DAOM 197198]
MDSTNTFEIQTDTFEPFQLKVLALNYLQNQEISTILTSILKLNSCSIYQKDDEELMTSLELDDTSENNDDERIPDASNRSANVQNNLENTSNENSENDFQNSATNDGNNIT